jgi:hypothetical protein
MSGEERIETARGGARGDDDERTCGAAGDLVREVFSDGALGVPAFPLELSRALVRGGAGAERPAARARRWFWLPTLAGVAAAAALVLLLGRGRPVRYEVNGGFVAAGGVVATTAGQRASLRFSDGTAIGLGPGSAGRVTARTSDGATFALDRGQASFDVVHRPHARWRVAAGPFEILVTGTRFDVDWSAEAGRGLRIDLHAGSVIVRGAVAGAGVPLRAGQHLSASLDRQSLVVGDGDGDGDGEGDGDDPAAVAPAPAPPEPLPPAPPAAIEPAPAPPAALAPAPAEERPARAERPRGARPASGAPLQALAPELPPAPLPAPPAPIEPPPLRLPDPAPWLQPAPPADSHLGAGGVATCLGWAPQYRFDYSIDGAAVSTVVSLAFSQPVLDHTRSWCGPGSLRVDATFDLQGTRNSLGERPHHTGEAIVTLPVAIDLTGKTLTAHFYVEGPSDVRFAAQIFAVNGRAKWVGGGFTPNLAPGRWLTLSHTFERENRVFEGGVSKVDEVSRLTLQVYAVGKDRTWNGRVYIDDIGWQ